ncbi:MAG: phosphatidate cytidylyltransferase [Bdellovibrionales bacterium]|nr:phosphatidate cytidylyltransferase [Bdellovibrionales bacterium]
MRILSALVAVALLVSVYIYFSTTGLFYICILAALKGILEFNKMAFNDTPHSLVKKLLFPVFGFTLLIISVYYAQYSSEFWALLLSLYLCLYIWLYGSKKSNDWLFFNLTKSAIGFFYVILLPVMALKTLELHYGETWFLLLLLIVFCGDTFAYFGGLKFGKKPLSQSLSPKKTLEGSYFGFLGSSCASLAVGLIKFPTVNPLYFVVLGLIAGLFAQTGDLFESLIKRIAQVKDSGSIMPGHGGVLDRVDGVLFASPIVYLFAFNTEKFLF